MDEHAQRALEFAKVREVLARYALTSMGKARALALAPDVLPENLPRVLQESADMLAAMREGFTLPLGSVDDVSGAARRAQAGGGPLEPAVLWKIADCLETAERVANALLRVGRTYPTLASLGASLPTCPDLMAHIRRAVDANARVLDEASPELGDVRRRIRRLREKIEELLRRMVENADVRPHLQYQNATICRDRYVLPVNAYSRHAVRGIVHGTSDSGATLYIEPMAAIEPGNELSEALSEEEEEVRRVLWELTRHVGASAPDIVVLTDRLGEVDLVQAKARMSAAFGMVKPQVSQGRALELRQARHPLLLWLTRRVLPALPPGAPQPLPREGDLDFGRVVPMDVRLGSDFDTLMLTGPNTGGKTVVLKTIGLVCLMARAGLHVPAEMAIVPVYDDLYADIGDEQSIEQSLSTFSSHMSRIIEILQCATPRSLVLLDELGAGTDPAEGAAIGEAVLKQLVALGCSAAVVTHLGRLKTFATSRPRVENAAMDFDMHTLRPTYRLTIGSVGSSNALEIAERLGLPQPILTDARALLDAESGGQYSSVLDEVRLAREDAEERRDRLTYLEGQAEKLRAQYEEVLARLKAEEDRRGADIGFQIRDSLDGLLAEAGRLHEDMRPLHPSLARRARALCETVQGCLDAIAELLEGHRLPHRLQAGDEVYVIKLHKWGTVERVDERHGRAVVQLGSAQVDVEIGDLQPWGEGLK